MSTGANITASPVGNVDALACVRANPVLTAPLDGLACTLRILPNVAIYRWRLTGEWVIVLGLLAALWLCCCCCCCVRCHRRQKNVDETDADADESASPAAEDRNVALKLEHTQGSQVCFSIRESARAGSTAQPPPPPSMPQPPPPPPGLGPGIATLDREDSRWLEHVDPSTGDKYFENETSGAVTWDEPAPHKILRG